MSAECRRPCRQSAKLKVRTLQAKKVCAPAAVKNRCRWFSQSGDRLDNATGARAHSSPRWLTPKSARVWYSLPGRQAAQGFAIRSLRTDRGKQARALGVRSLDSWEPPRLGRRKRCRLGTESPTARLARQAIQTDADKRRVPPGVPSVTQKSCLAGEDWLRTKKTGRAAPPLIGLPRRPSADHPCSESVMLSRSRQRRGSGCPRAGAGSQTSAQLAEQPQAAARTPACRRSSDTGSRKAVGREEEGAIAHALDG